MKWDRSAFGKKISTKTGILELMDDLGRAMSSGGPDLIMLGGGNPAAIPAVQEMWRSRMQMLLTDHPRQFDAMLCNYDTPQGRPEFISALVELFNNRCGWKITPDHIAISNGSQSGFFSLFNILAGEMSDGSSRKICIPLMPEYIGYADQGLTSAFFTSNRPAIEERSSTTFKYRVDFQALALPTDVSAIAISRPTNPTGNVVTREEVARLSSLAKERGIFCIVDNAYGYPFPNIIFTESELPPWEDHLVYSFSLSKIGLPGTRTGIIIAHPELVETLVACNAVMNLANGNVGQALTSALLREGTLLTTARTVVQPFYKDRADKAFKAAHRVFDSGLPWKLHVCEGALFFWLWMKDLPISSHELYQRLKKRGVLVVPGHYFFFGLSVPWQHQQECIRINYSQAPELVARGLEIIGEEMKKAYGE